MRVSISWIEKCFLAAKQLLDSTLTILTDGILSALYTGADAEYKAEGPLTDWLNYDYLKTSGKIIKVIKAGHHGSSAGTSTKLITNAKPDHYLISNGRNHYHPRPEVSFPQARLIIPRYAVVMISVVLTIVVKPTDG